MKARKRMWIDLDGDGTRFLNIDKASMVAVDKDDDSMKVYESLTGINDCRIFCGINANKIIEQLRGRDNGRAENE